MELIRTNHDIINNLISLIGTLEKIEERLHHVENKVSELDLVRSLYEKKFHDTLYSVVESLQKQIFFPLAEESQVIINDNGRDDPNAVDPIVLYLTTNSKGLCVYDKYTKCIARFLTEGSPDSVACIKTGGYEILYTLRKNDNRPLNKLLNLIAHGCGNKLRDILRDTKGPAIIRMNRGISPKYNKHIPVDTHKYLIPELEKSIRKGLLEHFK